MKNITTLVESCTMWKRVNIGTELIVPDPEAKEAIKNKWARKHPVDKTGKSIATGITWDFSTGATVSVTCYDFAKHVERTSGLDVTIRSAEFSKWLRKY